MQELRLVAVSEDGTYLVLATAGRGTRFTLPVDDRLRAAVRGNFSRLGQYEIEVESPLRPKEIQARIRAGETAEEIAATAGIPVERVRWFEGPVLQEREYVAQQAQRAAVRMPGESSSGPVLGDLVAERLNRRGVPTDEIDWDSAKRDDGLWRVKLGYVWNGHTRHAEWLFDPRRRHVSPNDDEAMRLSSADFDPDPVVEDTTVTPFTPRVAKLQPVPPLAADPLPFPSVVRQQDHEEPAVGYEPQARPPSYDVPPPTPAREAPYDRAPARETDPAPPHDGSAGRAPDTHRTEPSVRETGHTRPGETTSRRGGSSPWLPDFGQSRDRESIYSPRTTTPAPGSPTHPDQSGGPTPQSPAPTGAAPDSTPPGTASPGTTPLRASTSAPPTTRQDDRTPDTEARPTTPHHDRTPDIGAGLAARHDERPSAADGGAAASSAEVSRAFEPEVVQPPRAAPTPEAPSSSPEPTPAQSSASEVFTPESTTTAPPTAEAAHTEGPPPTVESSAPTDLATENEPTTATTNTASPAEATPAKATPAAESLAAETPVAEQPVAETPVAETPVAETLTPSHPVAESPAQHQQATETTSQAHGAIDSADSVAVQAADASAAADARPSQVSAGQEATPAPSPTEVQGNAAETKDDASQAQEAPAATSDTSTVTASDQATTAAAEETPPASAKTATSAVPEKDTSPAARQEDAAAPAVDKHAAAAVPQMDASPAPQQDATPPHQEGPSAQPQQEAGATAPEESAAPTPPRQDAAPTDEPQQEAAPDKEATPAAAKQAAPAAPTQDVKPAAASKDAAPDKDTAPAAPDVKAQPDVKAEPEVKAEPAAKVKSGGKGAEGKSAEGNGAGGKGAGGKPVPAARPSKEDEAKEEPAAKEEPPVPVPSPPPAPAARQPRKGSRGRRASVPTWDEIMFGARRQD